jgi:hypothetical protein
MLREPKVCRPLGLLCTCLCFSVLCEGRLLAQFVTVIDGYDVSLYDRTSPALSFSPFAENHWQLNYTSGRYLREIDPKIEVIARTFVNAASATSSRSLFVYLSRDFSPLPVLAYYTYEAKEPLQLRAFLDQAWQNLPAPPLQIPYFDVVAFSENDPEKIEWAFTDVDFQQRQSRMLHTYQQGASFIRQTSCGCVL